MVAQVTTFVTSVGGPEQVKRGMGKILKEHYAKLILRWHGHILPGHFRPGATTKYHYQKRKARYEVRKGRTKGHNIPLVYTGRMRDLVMQRIRVSSTSRGARGVMSGPRYMYMYRKDHNAPDKAAEITATTAQEASSMGQWLRERTTRAMNRIKTRKTERL